MVDLVDRCLARRRRSSPPPRKAPARLTGLPVRLTSRLAQGLVVGPAAAQPDQPAAFLRQRGEALALSLAPDVVDWLAENTPGSVRQLEGALRRVADLAAVLGQAVSLADLESAFSDEAERRRLTLEQITRQVGVYFRVDPRGHLLAPPRPGRSCCPARSACTWPGS